MSTPTISEQIPAGTYILDPVHSTFGFAIKHNGVSMFRGQFAQVEAEIVDGVLTGTAQVESVTTAIPDLKSHLLAPDFFNALETPEIAFRSTEIRISEAGSAEVDGELTIRGLTNQVTARGTFAHGENLRGKKVVGLELEGTIDRRDYGLNYQAKLPAGGDALGWEVLLEVALELVEV